MPRKIKSEASEPDETYWTAIIQSQFNPLQIPWKELWEYRELILRLVHRDFVSRYKQTVLGSAWYVVQPLFTSLMFTLVFNKIAKISTGEIYPQAQRPDRGTLKNKFASLIFNRNRVKQDRQPKVAPQREA